MWTFEEEDWTYIERLNQEIKPDEDTKSSGPAGNESRNTYWPRKLEFGDGLDRPKSLWGFGSESSTPKLLLTCQESRDVALKHYQPAFCSLGSIPPIYFDPLRDSLFLDSESFLG
jgi:hypothetical protein